MRKLLALLLVFGLAALTVSGSSAQSSLPDLAQYAPATGQPKVLKENMKTVTATVESIDLATRAVTLKNPDGKVMGLKVGEEVKNLPQVKVGDKVAVTYYESIAARIIKPVTGPASGAQQAVATAKPGEKPAGAMVQQVTVVATIEAIDKATQYVTLKGPEGKTIEVKVNNPKNLEDVKAGDEVAITCTEAMIVSVEKP
jgi:ribosomal 50S subunit-recycling heat shock protein